MLSFPLAIRVFLYPFYMLGDALYLLLRPHAANRNPLGYIFALKKV